MQSKEKKVCGDRAPVSRALAPRVGEPGEAGTGGIVGEVFPINFKNGRGLSEFRLQRGRKPAWMPDLNVMERGDGGLTAPGQTRQV